MRERGKRKRGRLDGWMDGFIGVYSPDEKMFT
jgi:hypothetical protein